MVQKTIENVVTDARLTSMSLKNKISELLLAKK